MPLPRAAFAAPVVILGTAAHRGEAAGLARGRAAAWLGAIEEGLLVGTLTLAPLPLGGARVWAWTVLEILVGLAVAVCLARAAVEGRLARVRMGGVGFVAVLLLALVLLQMIPLPAWLVSELSPRAAALYATAHETLGLAAPGWMTLSIAPHATRVALAQWLMYAAVFLLVLHVVRTREQARRLLTAVIVIGVLQAAYAIYERFNDVPRIFWYVRQYHLGSATGTFINRNHFASFLTAPMILALAGMVRPGPSRGRAERLGPRLAAFFSDERFGKRLILATFAVLMGAAIVLSTSRGALLACGATAAVALAALVWKPSRRRAAILVALVVLAAVALALWRGYDSLVPRLSPGGPDGASVTDRLAIMRRTLPAIADFPLVGAGLGAFEFAHRPHADLQLATRRADFAHNDYLQWTAELGLVGAAGLAALATVYVVWFARGLRRCRDDRLKPWAVGCLLAALPILLHAGFDFGLHIPAVAMMLVTVLALAAATTRMSSGRSSGAEAAEVAAATRPPATRPWWAAPACAAAAAGVLGLLVWPVCDLAAWNEVRDADSDRAPADASAACGRALAWTPEDPSLAHRRALATRAELQAACRDKVAQVLGSLTGGRQVPGSQVQPYAQAWLAPAVWAEGEPWLIERLDAAAQDAGRAILRCPGKAEFYLTRAHLELDRMRAGQADVTGLALADRAAREAEALAPNTSWVILDAGEYWAARWALAPASEAKANYERLLARAIRLDPAQSYKAMRAALQAARSLEAVRALATDDPYVQAEFRKLRTNLDPRAAGRVTVAIP